MNKPTDVAELTRECSVEEMLDRDNLVEAALRWYKLYEMTIDPSIELTGEIWHAFNVAEKTLAVAIMPLAVRRALEGDDDGEGIP